MRKQPILACGCPACRRGAWRKRFLKTGYRKLRRLYKAALRKGIYDQQVISIGYTD